MQKQQRLGKKCLLWSSCTRPAMIKNSRQNKTLNTPSLFWQFIFVSCFCPSQMLRQCLRRQLWFSSTHSLHNVHFHPFCCFLLLSGRDQAKLKAHRLMMMMMLSRYLLFSGWLWVNTNDDDDDRYADICGQRKKGWLCPCLNPFFKITMSFYPVYPSFIVQSFLFCLYYKSVVDKTNALLLQEISLKVLRSKEGQNTYTHFLTLKKSCKIDKCYL